jgi:hypothetical protein
MGDELPTSPEDPMTLIQLSQAQLSALSTTFDAIAMPWFAMGVAVGLTAMYYAMRSRK